MRRIESSLAAAASSSATAEQSVPLYLVITKDSAGKITKVRLSSAPLEIKEKQISSVELTSAHIKLILFPADADLPGDRGPITAVFRRKIASFATPLFNNPNNSEERTKLSDFNIEEALHLQGDRLRRIALAVSHAVNLETRTARNTTFFRENIDIPEDVLDAALNGDAHVVWLMLTQNPNYVSYRGTATITHLDIERTGTLLQMALYSHDEKLVAFIQKYMDPAEFQRQWEEVFGPDYNDFLARQQTEATRLCGELEDAFKAASATDVTNALNRVANTSSALQDALNRFKDNLERYVGESRVHNPYILQRLFEIYDTPTFDNWNKDCLLSQQAIGVAQKLSSARWLQHLSQGIFYLGQNELSRRSFGLRDSRRFVDIRSLDRLGVDSCIHLFAERASAGGPQWLDASRAWNWRYQNLCRAKTADFQKIMPRVQSTTSHIMSNKYDKLSELITPEAKSTDCCCLIQ